MNKTFLITGVIIAGVVLFGGGYLLLHRFHTNPKTNYQTYTSQTNPTQTTQTSQITAKKSLHDLMSLGGSQKCTFADTQAQSSGTVYTGNGSMRGDFKSQGNGKSSQTHMISDGKYMYFWIEGETKGYKVSLDAVEKLSNSSLQQYQSQAMDMKKQVDYTCSPWTVDGSLFAVPASIEFQDFTSMMQGVMTGASSSPSSMMQDNQSACSQCDKLPASAQAQCRTALKC